VDVRATQPFTTTRMKMTKTVGIQLYETTTVQVGL
jgi:hypothetical protein